jgi:DNA-binding SARP family transcriptional activator
MSRICIQLFGRFCIRQDRQVVPGFDAYKMQELLGYLLLHRHHPISRESLASVLWPDTTTTLSRKKLRQLLWQLQSALGSQTEAPHDRLLLVEPDQVQMNVEAGYWLDVAVFEKTFKCVQKIASQELDTQNVQALHNAVQLYRGPLLDGCYEDWCLSQREYLQNMYLTMVEKLMSYCEIHHDYETGIQYGMRVISCDKVRECTYRHLMRLYYLNGDRAKALGLYEQCSMTLEKELGVKPSKRTTAFYKQILTEQLAAPEPTAIPTEAQPAFESSNASLIETLGYLTQLQEFLTALQSQVQQSMQHVERVLSKNSNPLSPTKIDEGKDVTETL